MSSASRDDPPDRGDVLERRGDALVDERGPAGDELLHREIGHAVGGERVLALERVGQEERGGEERDDEREPERERDALARAAAERAEREVDDRQLPPQRSASR